MGSGKTSLGKKIARKLSLEFIDLDNVITGSTGESIRETFEHKGEDFFRLAERAALVEQIKKDSFVMAVGGGTPCFYDNMEAMNRYGLTVYLKLSPDALFSRLKGRTWHRPLLKGMENENLVEYITVNLNKREKWYLESALIIEEAEQEPDIIISKISNYSPGSGLA